MKTARLLFILIFSAVLMGCAPKVVVQKCNLPPYKKPEPPKLIIPPNATTAEVEEIKNAHILNTLLFLLKENEMLIRDYNECVGGVGMEASADGR